MNADHPFHPQPGPYGGRMCVCGEPATSHPAPGSRRFTCTQEDPEIDRMIALADAERDVVNAAIHYVDAFTFTRRSTFGAAVARLLALRAADTADI